MALEIAKKDLFKVPADTRVISINLKGAMGAGVARIARDTIPGLYKHYRKMYARITQNQFIRYQAGDVLWLLVPTKIDWRKPSPRSLVEGNLRRLADLAIQHPSLGTIALPPLGCGHGGLSWLDDISYLYEEVLSESPREFIACLGPRRG